MSTTEDVLFARNDDISGLIATLKEQGLRTMANLPMAREYLKRLRKFFPSVKMINGTGQYGVGQIFYLPSAKRTVESMLRHDLYNSTLQYRAHRCALERFKKLEGKA